MIQCDKEIEARRSAIDVAKRGDVRVCDKELEKTEKYKLLKDEIARV